MKYEYNKEYEVIMVDWILHSSVVYPTSYGYIPGTLSDDGDPIDVLVIQSAGIELAPGCIVTARPVAVLRMKDEEGIDDKIIAVIVNDPRLEEIKSLELIPKHLLREIEEFFNTYKHLERGKTTEIVGWENKAKSTEIISDSIQRFNQKRKGE